MEHLDGNLLENGVAVDHNDLDLPSLSGALPASVVLAEWKAEARPTAGT